MKIDGVAIVSEIQAYYEQLVQDADDSEILAYAERTPSIAKGFRKHKSNAGVLRKRILKNLKSESEILGGLKEFLAISSQLANGLYCLSSSVIETRWRDLLACYGHEVVAAALVDDRRPVRTLAVKAMSSINSLTANKPDEAKAMLSRIVNCVYAAFEDSYVSGGSDEEQSEETEDVSPPDTSETDRLRDRIRELEKELKEHGTRSRRLHALEEKLDKTNSKIKRLTEANKKAKKDTRALEKQIEASSLERDAAKAKALEIETAIQESIDAGVKREFKELRNHWLLPLAGAETRIQAVNKRRARAESLEKRVEDALKKQANIDRHSGNMSELRARKAELMEMAAALDNAIADAVHPLGELAILREQLDAEIAGVCKIVDGARETMSEAAVRIRSVISNADESDRLEELRSLVEELSANGVLAGGDVRALYRAYWGKMCRLYAEYGPRVVKAGDSQMRDPLLLLLQPASGQGQRTFLAVDGYNVILGVPELFGDVLEPDGRPSDAARDRLVSLLVPRFNGWVACDIRLVFDSDVRSEQGHGNNVMSIFSGGQGDHRADNVILEELRAYRQGYAGSILIVVTNDHDLRDQARKEGARIMTVDAFAAILTDDI